MSVIIKGEPTTIEAYMIDNMKISQPNHIKIARFAFNCETIEDADGTIYRKERKGKWVRYDGDWLKTMYKCSECGAMIDINEKYKNFFCYHCGARMDDEQV